MLKRKQGVILAHADIVAGIEFGAALTNNDIAGQNLLAAKLLYAKAAAVGIATIARRAA
jgi:hypothetical protein